MTAISYTTDLQNVTLVENTATFVEITAMAAGGTPDVTDTDDPIQGQYLVSQTAKIAAAAVASMVHDNTTNITLSAGQVFLIWHKFDAGGILDTYANGGVRAVVATSLTVWSAWKVGGRDVPPNPYGGWTNYPIDPTLASDYNLGSLTTYRYVGAAIVLTATGPSRGQPHKIDAIRYGRGEVRIVGGTSPDSPGTFAGIATQNDNSSNRWGLFQAILGGYLWKGLITFGYGGVVDFRDSNVSITLQDIRKVASTFNKIEFRNASSRVDWTGVNITNPAPSTNASRGSFEVIDDCDINLNGCTFTDMGTFIFKSVSTSLTCTFRRCQLVTQNSSVFTGCTFDSTADATRALLCNDPSKISKCNFISSGTKHAIELTAACAGNSYAFSDNNFTGYAAVDGSTGNEVIYNNSGGAVTINYSGGSGVISVRNGVGASTTVSNSVNLTINIVDSAGIAVTAACEVTVAKESDSTVLYHSEDVTTGSCVYAYTSGAGTLVYINILNVTGYQPKTLGNYALPASSGPVTISLDDERFYSNP